MSNTTENIIQSVNIPNLPPTNPKPQIPNPNLDKMKEQMSEYMAKAGQYYDTTREKAKPMLEFIINYWYWFYFKLFIFIF